MTEKMVYLEYKGVTVELRSGEEKRISALKKGGYKLVANPKKKKAAAKKAGE